MLVKPNVVFFGDSIPKERTAAAEVSERGDVSREDAGETKRCMSEKGLLIGAGAGGPRPELTVCQEPLSVTAGAPVRERRGSRAGFLADGLVGVSTRQGGARKWML